MRTTNDDEKIGPFEKFILRSIMIIRGRNTNRGQVKDTMAFRDYLCCADSMTLLCSIISTLMTTNEITSFVSMRNDD